MTELTNKAREDFFEWLRKSEEPIWQLDGEDSDGMYIYLYPSVVFDELPQSAQFGLIQEWGDTLKDFTIRISPRLTSNGIIIEWKYEIYSQTKGWYILERGFKSRSKAQREAVKKLSEIYNQLKDK